MAELEFVVKKEMALDAFEKERLSYDGKPLDELTKWWLGMCRMSFRAGWKAAERAAVEQAKD